MPLVPGLNAKLWSEGICCCLLLGLGTQLRDPLQQDILAQDRVLAVLASLRMQQHMFNTKKQHSWTSLHR